MSTAKHLVWKRYFVCDILIIRLWLVERIAISGNPSVENRKQLFSRRKMLLKSKSLSEEKEYPNEYPDFVKKIKPHLLLNPATVSEIRCRISGTFIRILFCTLILCLLKILPKILFKKNF
ncbi:hypothetical protein Avbf_02356 [Armadillidium vulgare]|nr:hypothetical protein Avbf_02356 [Armadillidium vulgare]